MLSRLDMKTTMLLQKAKALKLKYFGHIKRHETLERQILEARIDGRRGRGRPTRRWEQDINDWMDMTTTQAGRLAEDRILFRQKVQEATSRQEISWSRERFWPSHIVTILFVSSFSCRGPAWLGFFYLSFFDLFFFFFWYLLFYFFVLSFLVLSFFLSFLFLLLAFSFSYFSLFHLSLLLSRHILVWYLCETWNNKSFSCYFIYPAPLF